MNAIEWMDARTHVVSVDVITVSPEEADCPEEVGTYEITLECFGGVLPYRMRKEAFKIAASIKNTPELKVSVRGYQKSEIVEYFKTTTRRVA